MLAGVMDPAARFAVYVGHARLWASVLVGSLTGVLQLEGLAGFVVYAAVCVAGLSVAVKMYKPREAGPVTDVAMNSIFSGLFTYALFWTLFFNLFADEWRA